MITLYGVAISNYYNKVKFALLEKEIPFSEQLMAPGKSPRSPLGKIPFIETPEGDLSESQAILEYLEDAFPANPLYPAQPYQRAQCRELIQHLELNIELIARRLYGELLFGQKVSDEIKQEVTAKVEAGLAGLSRLTEFSEFALGDRFSAADVVAWPHLQLVGYATSQLLGRDLVAERFPHIEHYMKRIESRPHAQTVSRDRTAALEAFFKNR